MEMPPDSPKEFRWLNLASCPARIRLEDVSQLFVSYTIISAV